METLFFLDLRLNFYGYRLEEKGFELSKDEKQKNADDIFEKVEIVKTIGGGYCAVFTAAIHPRGEKAMQVVSTLDELMESKQNYQKEGLVSPLTDKAIRLLREAMNLPELH